MGIYLCVFTAAAIFLASPAAQAHLGQTADLASINHTSFHIQDVANEILAYVPPESIASFSLASTATHQIVQHLPIQTFAANVAAIVVNSPFMQTLIDVIALKRKMAPIMMDLVVPVRLLLQEIGRQKLAADSKLAVRFLYALIAIQMAHDRALTLHLTIRDYIFLRRLRRCYPELFDRAIGNDVTYPIRSTLADSGLGIDSAWDPDQILWVFEHPNSIFLQDQQIRFSQGDLAAAWCAVIDAEKLRINPDVQSPLTPTIIHAVLSKMKKVLSRMNRATSTLILQESTQSALRLTTLKSRPLPYDFTNIQNCRKDRPDIGAIFAAFHQVLDSARFYEIPLGTHSLLTKSRLEWLTRQTDLIGINAVGLFWLATIDISIFNRFTIKRIYSACFKMVYPAIEMADSKPKEFLQRVQAANDGIFGWPTQEQIVLELVHQEKYSQAVDVVKLLADKELLPAYLIKQVEKIEEVLLLYSWTLSKRKKLNWLKRVFKANNVLGIKT